MKTLNLGCGITPLAGAVNHDLTAHADHVDIAHDLDSLPWPWPDGVFDRIVAEDVMEHLRVEVRDWLGECWRLLGWGGELHLRVPHWGTEAAHANPTHHRAFSLRTFDFWCPERSWYEAYGKHDPTLAAGGRLWAIDDAQREYDNCVFTLRRLKEYR